MLRLIAYRPAVILMGLFLGMTLCSFGASVVLLRRQVAIQLRLAEAEATMKDYERRAATANTVQDQRLTVLETAMFANHPPKDMTAVQLWQKNRDKELRDRLTALERWRLAQDGRR